MISIVKIRKKRSHSLAALYKSVNVLCLSVLLILSSYANRVGSSRTRKVRREGRGRVNDRVREQLWGRD